MLPSFLLSLREGIEAALIIGIVLGALRQMRRTDLNSTVWLGTLSAAALSILGGVLLTMLGLSFEGPAEQIFEGTTMILAAALLTWMIFWMNRTARNLKSSIEGDIQRAALATGKRAVFFVAFLAILREGIELALFLTASVFATDTVQTLLGALLGLGTAILLGWSIFAAIIRLDLRRFFQVTGILLILFAAGLVAHGIHEFNEVGWIPAVIEHVWDVNTIVDENSTFGQLLKALFGYNGNPSLTEVIAYLVYFVTILLGLKWVNKPQPVTAHLKA
jgi:high-affinity iron transporter